LTAPTYCTVQDPCSPKALLKTTTKKKKPSEGGKKIKSNSISPWKLRMARSDNGEAVVFPGPGQRGRRVGKGVSTSDV
jgi:hypothetical protein